MLRDAIYRILTSRWSFVAVLLLNTVVFTVLALSLPMAFEENDDFVMAMIANGAYSGVPDYHLVFINVIYGYMLTLLYGLTKAIEWYTLSFAVLHILSMSVLIHYVLTIPNRSAWERVLWIIVLYVFWARIIAALQFTTTAGLTCLAGCVLLLRENKKARWTGVLFVVIASLIRVTAAGLTGVLMAPILVYTYRLEWRKYIPLAVMLLLVVGCRVVNHKVYDSDPEWKYYNEYNGLRGQLTDNPNAYKMQPEDMPEGIDWMDYQLLLRFIPDPEKMDLPTLRRLHAVVGGVPFTTKLQNIYYLDQYAVELVILLALLILMILTTGNVSKHIFLILYTGFILALMIYVSLDGFLKQRVFLCMLAPMLFTDFMLLPKTTGHKRQKGIVIAMVTLFGWLCYQTNAQCRMVYNKSNVWTKMQRPLLEKLPNDAVQITVAASMFVEVSNPWHIWPYAFTKYTFGWLTWNPLNKPNGHSYRVLLKDNVYLYTVREYEDDESSIQMVRERIEHNYGVPTEIKCLYRNDQYAIVQLKVKESS